MPGKKRGMKSECAVCECPNTDEMVECETCLSWTHYDCAKLSDAQITNINSINYTCQLCNADTGNGDKRTTSRSRKYVSYDSFVSNLNSFETSTQNSENDKIKNSTTLFNQSKNLGNNSEINFTLPEIHESPFPDHVDAKDRNEPVCINKSLFKSDSEIFINTEKFEVNDYDRGGFTEGIIELLANEKCLSFINESILNKQEKTNEKEVILNKSSEISRIFTGEKFEHLLAETVEGFMGPSEDLNVNSNVLNDFNGTFKGNFVNNFINVLSGRKFCEFLNKSLILKDGVLRLNSSASNQQQDIDGHIKSIDRKSVFVSNLTAIFRNQLFEKFIDENVLDKTNLSEKSRESCLKGITNVFSREKFVDFLNETIIEENGELKIVEKLKVDQISKQNFNHAKATFISSFTETLCDDEFSKFLNYIVLDENKFIKENSVAEQNAIFMNSICDIFRNNSFLDHLNDTLVEEDGEVRIKEGFTQLSHDDIEQNSKNDGFKAQIASIILDQKFSKLITDNITPHLMQMKDNLEKLMNDTLIEANGTVIINTRHNESQKQQIEDSNVSIVAARIKSNESRNLKIANSHHEMNDNTIEKDNLVLMNSNPDSKEIVTYKNGGVDSEELVTDVDCQLCAADSEEIVTAGNCLPCGAESKEIVTLTDRNCLSCGGNSEEIVTDGKFRSCVADSEGKVTDENCLSCGAGSEEIVTDGNCRSCDADSEETVTEENCWSCGAESEEIVTDGNCRSCGVNSEEIIIDGNCRSCAANAADSEELVTAGNCLSCGAESEELKIETVDPVVLILKK